MQSESEVTTRDAGVETWLGSRGANNRSEIVAEDILAIIGACAIGSRRLRELLDRYGLTTFERQTDHVIAASEPQVRAVIERWPDEACLSRREFQGASRAGPPAGTRAVMITVAGWEITFACSETDG